MKKVKKMTIIKISIVVIFIIIILPIIIFKREPIIFTFKSFNAGEKVTFSGTEWYVIKDTGIDEKEVELISKLPFDLNLNSLHSHHQTNTRHYLAYPNIQ